MTYGTLDGTLPPKETPKPQPQDYAGPMGGAPTDGDVGTVTTNSVGEPPKVPSGTGGDGTTTVDTPSLRTFADNMTVLKDRARASLDQLSPVDVRSGGFGEAVKMRNKVNRQRDDFTAVLEKLVEGLTDLSNSMGKLATDYDTTEEMNSVKATTLQDAMAEPQADFQGLLTAHGSTT